MALAVASAVTMMMGTWRHPRCDRRSRRVKDSPLSRGPACSTKITPGSRSRQISSAIFSSGSRTTSRAPMPLSRSAISLADATLGSTISARRTTGAIFAAFLGSVANTNPAPLSPEAPA